MWENKMKTILLGLSVLFAVSAEAASVKIPALYACMGSTGAITVRQKCKAGELKLTAQTLSSQGATGLQGPQGVQGPKGDSGTQGPRGLVSSSICTLRKTFFSGSNTIISVGACLNTEFMMTHGIFVDNASASIVDAQLLTDNFGRVGGVSYALFSPIPVNGNVQVYCCLDN